MKQPMTTVWNLLGICAAAIAASLLTFTIIPAVASADHTDELFSDGFESGDTSAWTDSDGWDVVGADAYEGEFKARASNHSGGDHDTLSIEVSTLDYKDIVLEFAHKETDLEPDDSLYVQFSRGGEEWETIAEFTDGNESFDWSTTSIELDADNNSTVELRFVSYLDSEDDLFHLDNVNIYGIEIDDADTNDDGFISVAEGQPFYGSIVASLTTEGSTTPESALALDRFPEADADGDYVYERTFAIGDEIEDLTDAHIVIHGIDIDDSGAYDGEKESSIAAGVPFEATVPTACGEIVSDGSDAYEANINELNSSGAYGEAVLSLDGDHLTIILTMDATSPELAHAQHIHLGGMNECPPNTAGVEHDEEDEDDDEDGKDDDDKDDESHNDIQAINLYIFDNEIGVEVDTENTFEWYTLPIDDRDNTIAEIADLLDKSEADIEDLIMVVEGFFEDEDESDDEKDDEYTDVENIAGGLQGIELTIWDNSAGAEIDTDETMEYLKFDTSDYDEIVSELADYLSISKDAVEEALVIAD